MEGGFGLAASPVGAREGGEEGAGGVKQEGGEAMDTTPEGPSSHGDGQAAGATQGEEASGHARASVKP